MIIYDNNKQFIGIDEENLKSLGYSNLASLQAESADFADLFIKTPGHIHNFKHVHWIDFILCSTDKSSSKAIIHANGKNFSCLLDIKTIYLSSAPTKASFIILLNNLRLLSAEENQEISGELQSRVAPVCTTYVPPTQEDEVLDEKPDIEAVQEVLAQIQQVQEIQEDPYEVEEAFDLDVFEPTQEELDRIGDAQHPEDEEDQHPDPEDELISREDLSQHLSQHVSLDEDVHESETLEEEKKEKKEHIIKEKTLDENYVFDIKETAEALEMDVATIEDFVQDFIVQAKDFKQKLYEAVHQDDMIELKALSHQLKGVAANLRIHDAEAILVKINKDPDFTTSIVDLDKFYHIISKLSGQKEQEDVQEKEIAKIEIEVEQEPEELSIDLDEPIEINEDLQIDEPLQMESFENLDLEQDQLIKSKESQELLDEVDQVKVTPAYDKMRVANEIGLDEESFNELFEDYSNESSELISEIQTAIENENPSEWQHAAVKLKGMSDNMRIEEFKPELEVLITTQDTSDAKNITAKINETLLQILDKKA